MKNGNMSRRGFMKLLGGAGVAGLGAAAAGCGTLPAGGKGWMPNQYNVSANWPVQVKGRIPIDSNNPAIERDDTKCILCGQCLEVCRNVMSVYGYYELPLKKDITCVHCGQCTMWCPTGAITERNDMARVLQVLEEGRKHVIVQTAPATKVALGEEFGLLPGSIVQGKQVAALRQLGFSAVFDTSFAADLTVMEEAAELLHRVSQNDRTLPQFTSCCPGWVKFCEYFYPDLEAHLSSCKSPQQMLGAIGKTYYAEQKGIQPENIFSVAIMPCTAKKYECQLPGMQSAGHRQGTDGAPDVDAVLTTRELAMLLKTKNIDIERLPDMGYDSIMGESSGAGVIFGATGGVTEASVRTAYYMASGQQPPDQLLDWTSVRGLQGVKEATAELPGVGTVSVAVCHGLKNARRLLDRVRAGKAPWQFIEVMACPGGCIGGGGQPRTSLPPTDEIRMARITGVYALDQTAGAKRASYQNQEVNELYKKYLEKPLSPRAEELLHTHFVDRSNQLTVKQKYAAKR